VIKYLTGNSYVEKTTIGRKLIKNFSKELIIYLMIFPGTLILELENLSSSIINTKVFGLVELIKNID
jgi:hypothetical protein